MKSKMIEKIRQIVIDEKFKLDAYFLCGVASSLPNQKLQKACERYLEAHDNNKDTTAQKEELVVELKEAIDAKPKVKVIGDLVNNKPDIEEVYENRHVL